jgi:alanine racemase
MIINNKQTEYPYTTTNSNEPTPQTFLEISAAAFNHNASFYKNLVGQHNLLAAVIKGNGYGHGLNQMAYLCEQNSFIDWLLVAQLSEALAMQNIIKPILVMNYCDVSAEYAVGKNIHFMVDNIAYAQNLNAIGKKHSYRFGIHLKIDTGLCRMGVLANQALTFINQLQNLDYLQLNGICSHFAASDTNPEFTTQQYTTFNNIIADLKLQNITIPLVHMSNSAAISIVDYQPHFNFFRTGVGLYGLGHERSNLQPIMTWKTHIVNIKTVPANSYISYASTYQTTRVTRLALLPVGYFDVYKFRFSNKTSVIINGSPAPVLGRIAMNMTIVDVTDIPANIGDEVVLVGSGPHINAHDLALKGEVPNVREILVGINPSIARIITK